MEMTGGSTGGGTSDEVLPEVFCFKSTSVKTPTPEGFINNALLFPVNNNHGELWGTIGIADFYRSASTIVEVTCEHNVKLSTYVV